MNVQLSLLFFQVPSVHDFTLKNLCYTLSNVVREDIKLFNWLIRSVKGDVSENIVFAWEEHLSEFVVSYAIIIIDIEVLDKLENF